MAETKGSLQLTLDPISPIHSHYSDPLNSYFVERGPRYNAYAQLRESKLRSKRLEIDQPDPYSDTPRSEFTPAKKSVKFQEITIEPNKKRRSSVLVQSVSDFSPAVTKENRRPPINQIPRAERNARTPPLAMSKREKVCGSETKVGAGGWSRSMNSGEKQSGGRLMRKSYASIEELKGLSIAASTAINGENRGAKRSNVLRKSTVFSTRYY